MESSSSNMSHFLFFLLINLVLYSGNVNAVSLNSPLRFRENGVFKILQVADMHYVYGKNTTCLNVFDDQLPYCSDLNTTAFLERMIHAEKPDFIVFTGDQIMGMDTDDLKYSLDQAFAAVKASKIPWAAILGNHDSELGWDMVFNDSRREMVMKHIVGMEGTLSKLNPENWPHNIDGWGNYNLEVGGVAGSSYANKSVLNLYFLDSGDHPSVDTVYYYGWVKLSQRLWFQKTSHKLKKVYMKKPEPQKGPAPGIAYFHIPTPEFALFNTTNVTTGVRQERSSPADVNSGLFTTLLEAGDVKAAFIGHDHLNDFCAKLTGINLCYAGGFGYHAYGKAGWSRRARVTLMTLEKAEDGGWGGMKSIRTWKRLDDEHLTVIDREVLWTKSSSR